MNHPTQPPPIPSERHGCLTAWLILMIVANAVTAVMTPLSVSSIRQAGIAITPVGIAVVVVCAIANIICAIALFRWQRWGFYGFIVTSAIALLNNLSSGLGLGRSISGLVGLGLLFLVLHLGGERKAWRRLK